MANNNSPLSLGNLINPSIPLPAPIPGQISTYTGGLTSGNVQNITLPANASPPQQLQVATNQNQLALTQLQLQKMQLPPFEITSVPFIPKISKIRKILII